MSRRRLIEALCDAIAGELKTEHDRVALVLPALPFGPTPEHAGFGSGYVNLRQSTHEAVIEDILESLAAQGFVHLLIWRGCGQHDLAGVIERFNRGRAGARASQPVIDYPRISAEAFGRVVPGGHADSFATSLCLLLRHEAVRPAHIRRPHNTPFIWSEVMDFAAISDTGVIGDPTHASEATGRRIWDRVVREGADIVLALIDDPTAPVQQRWRFA